MTEPDRPWGLGVGVAPPPQQQQQQQQEQQPPPPWQQQQLQEEEEQAAGSWPRELRKFLGLVRDRDRPWQGALIRHLCLQLPSPGCYIYQVRGWQRCS